LIARFANRDIRRDKRFLREQGNGVRRIDVVQRFIRSYRRCGGERETARENTKPAQDNAFADV
jgi:hypothetical protein